MWLFTESLLNTVGIMSLCLKHKARHIKHANKNTDMGKIAKWSIFYQFYWSIQVLHLSLEEINHDVRLVFWCEGAESGESVWRSLPTMGICVLWGEWQLPAVHFNWCASGSEKTWGDKNQLPLCLHGDQAFSKEWILVACNVFLMLAKGAKIGCGGFPTWCIGIPLALPSQAAAKLETLGCLFAGTFKEGQNLGCSWITK